MAGKYVTGWKEACNHDFISDKSPTDAMTCEPQLVAAASGPAGTAPTDEFLSPLLPRPEMPCRRHAGAEVLYPLAASVPHGAGGAFF